MAAYWSSRTLASIPSSTMPATTTAARSKRAGAPNQPQHYQQHIQQHQQHSLVPYPHQPAYPSHDTYDFDEQQPPQSPSLAWDMDELMANEQPFMHDIAPTVQQHPVYPSSALPTAPANLFPSPEFPSLPWPSQESWQSPMWNPVASSPASMSLNTTNLATVSQPASAPIAGSPSMYSAALAMRSVQSASPPSPSSPSFRQDTALEEFGASPSLLAGALSAGPVSAFAQFPTHHQSQQYGARSLLDAVVDSQWPVSPAFQDVFSPVHNETYDVFNGLTAETAYPASFSPYSKQPTIDTNHIFGFATNEASSSTESLVQEPMSAPIPIPGAMQIPVVDQRHFAQSRRPSPRREQSLPPRSPESSFARMYSGPSSMPNLSTMTSPTAASKPTFMSPGSFLQSPSFKSPTSAISASAPSPVLFINQTAQFSTNRSSREDSTEFGPSSAGVREARNRKRKRLQSPELDEDSDERRDEVPNKSELRPPKQAPSMWQLYFADWLQQHKSRFPNDKLNVAQAAKEAGVLYKNITHAEKEDLKRRVQVEKDARERRLQAWQRTLTPEDIRRENRYRTAQRKAGLSRRANIKDPNAPKKPLSAYFMFLAKIRSEPTLVDEVFGSETETTRQSVLAAKRWREMSDEEKRPFLTQAEHDKLQYEAARKVYEDRATSVTGTGYIVPAQSTVDVTAAILAKPQPAEPLQITMPMNHVNFSVFTPNRPAPRSRVSAPAGIPSTRKRGHQARRLSNTDSSEDTDSDDEWVPSKSD